MFGFRGYISLPVEKEDYIIKVHVISSMKIFVEFQQDFSIQNLENYGNLDAGL